VEDAGGSALAFAADDRPAVRVASVTPAAVSAVELTQ
jgi:hypothetical protein